MRKFIPLFLAFIVAYVVMVVTHEAGHYAMARAMGYSRARIHSTHTDTGVNVVLAEYKAILARNSEAVRQDAPFPERERLMELNAQVTHMGDALRANHYDLGKGAAWIYCGGPLMTIIIASMGVALLRRQKGQMKDATGLNGVQWLLVLAAAMWVKPIYDLVGSFAAQLIKGDAYLPTDEYKMCAVLGIYPWTANIVEAIAGIIFLRMLFGIVPQTDRRLLVIAGLSGGIAGFVLWHFVGLVLLP